MERTRIKICGITRVEDAIEAVRAGADAIGMVFYKHAKRCISLEQAREILAALPPFVTPVGLFVDASPDEVRHIAGMLGLRHIQLHGHEDAGCVRQLQGFSLIKAVRVTKDTFRSDLDRWREAIRVQHLHHLRGLVLETAAALPGGTGLFNDWETIKQAQADGTFDGLPHIIAAGGLTKENVGDVVRDLRPWAVDVSSGVESRLGQKSVERMNAFVAAVRAAE